MLGYVNMYAINRHAIIWWSERIVKVNLQPMSMLLWRWQIISITMVTYESRHKEKVGRGLSPQFHNLNWIGWVLKCSSCFQLLEIQDQFIYCKRGGEVMKFCHNLLRIPFMSQISRGVGYLFCHKDLGMFYYLCQEGYVFNSVCGFVCLFVSLLTTLHKKLWMDLDEIFREGQK